MQWREQNARVDVRDEDYKRFLRYPVRRTLEGAMAENAAWARDWYERHGRPWWCGRLVETFAATAEGVRLGEAHFPCPTLAQRAARARACVVVGVSAGPELDEEATRRWSAEEPDRAYFLQAWGGAVVATLLERARLRVAHDRQAEDAQVKFGYAPGYPDWPIDDMPRLREVLAGGEPLAGTLDVLSSGMLVPRKSQLVVFFVEPPS